MANKWTRRGRGQRRKKDRTVDVHVDLRTGAMTCSTGDASIDARCHYYRRHDLVPKTIQTWSRERLQDVVQIAKISGKTAHWERALMLLAHHESELACDMLRDLEPVVPEVVATFWEMAYAESLGWLGYDYIPDEEGRPMAVPAGMQAQSGRN